MTPSRASQRKAPAPRRTSRPRRPGSSLPGLLAAACWLLAACASAAELRVAFASTVENSGLAAALAAAYRESCGCELRYLAAGSTQALAYLARGDVALAVTHAPQLEVALVDVQRRPLMRSEFVLVGPPADPAGVRGLALAPALRRLAAHESPFLSRADGSGTNLAERELWTEALGHVPAAEPWYRGASVAMAKLLLIAAAKRSYAVSDSATYAYLRQRRGLALEVLARDAPGRPNVYSVMLPDGASAAARAFAAWLASAEARDLIDGYRVAGAPAFAALR